VVVVTTTYETCERQKYQQMVGTKEVDDEEESCCYLRLQIFRANIFLANYYLSALAICLFCPFCSITANFLLYLGYY